MSDRGRASADLIARRGPALAAILAFLTGLPSLRLPFLADDWALLADADKGILARTPFGYFRPLCALTYGMELDLWGVRPFFFHLTNLALVTGVAALIVVLILQLTGDAPLAGLTGLLFALHPYHVENVFWVAGRTDLLCGLFFLLALLAYERWQKELRGVPVTALLLFEAALLSKETAAALPALLPLIRLASGRGRPGKEELLRGYVSFLVVAVSHFLLLRYWALGGPGLEPWQRTGARWMSNYFAFLAAALFGLHTDFLEGRPRLYGTLALAVVVLSAIGIRAVRGRVPRILLPAACAFTIVLAPSLLSFQERYFLLPSAASALAMACLARELPASRRLWVLAPVAIVWLGSLGWHWSAWNEAGRASERLIRGLKSASLTPGVGEIVVANMPHRIRAVAVFGNFEEAVALSGGRRVPIRVAAALDYPAGREDDLEGGFQQAVAVGQSAVEVRLRVHRGRFSRLVLPPAPASGLRVETEWAEVRFGSEEEFQVRIARRPDGARAAYVWSGGRLELLFAARR